MRGGRIGNLFTSEDENNSYSLSPNPATSITSIKLPNSDASTFTIFNAKGIAMSKSTFEAQEVNLNLDGLETGIYTVLIYQNGSVATKKLHVVK